MAEDAVRGCRAVPAVGQTQDEAAVPYRLLERRENLAAERRWAYPLPPPLRGGPAFR